VESDAHGAADAQRSPRSREIAGAGIEPKGDDAVIVFVGHEQEALRRIDPVDVQAVAARIALPGRARPDIGSVCRRPGWAR
jgi:hypothetical protein